MKKDKITLQTGATPTKEEILTANFLVENRENCSIRFLAVSKIKNVHTPDIEMDKLRWETKCPVGNSNATIKRIFKTAIKQSPNLILTCATPKCQMSGTFQSWKKNFATLKALSECWLSQNRTNYLILTKTLDF